MMSNIVFLKHRMHEYVKSQLEKAPKLHYLQRVWRYRNDTNFVEQVMNLNHDPDTFKVKCFGEKNPDKNIYFIFLDRPMGLGGYLRCVFYGLIEAEIFGFIPVISFQSNKCPYSEASLVLGAKNPFEYYFERVSNLSVEEVYESKRVVLFSEGHELRGEHDLGNINAKIAGGYNFSEDYLRSLARLQKQYIRLNQSTSEAIEIGKKTLCSFDWNTKNILGVHIRGTDYALNWKNHPNMVSADDFITAIDNALQEYHFDYIFLATDDANRLKSLQERYGDKLLYYKDVHRGTGNISVAEEKNDRPLNRYLNGLEVVRDMYTLASCSGLVCGLSQVSFMARIIRLSQGSPYEFLKVLDNGIYKG